MDQWLSGFQSFWLQKDIEGVLSLFTDDVEYWETPFKRLHSKDEIRQTWGAIANHNIEDLRFEIKIADETNRLWAIHWTYKRSQNEWRGTYLMHLDPNGLCDYFLQCGESA